ncbi:cytochrome b-c1 complex subunit 10-like [Acomys russatus]|uniref:cytochrome b-c1 complex subunit 10-like n=1 Tax=Acomys russatus TaxID=60746 RepID=UPI0021E2752B|nr:cytochrome b-c1 complex subunit 10-like [Acomys russatus]
MLSRFLHPHYRKLSKNWVPTGSMWGTVGAVGLVWATDWYLILDWVPYINGKFKKELGAPFLSHRPRWYHNSAAVEAESPRGASAWWTLGPP